MGAAQVHTNTTVNRYGSIAAEIYDLDKPAGALPDTAFHLQQFSGFEGSILEPACGSGRTLLPFLQAGFDISGFDPSAEMLDRCRSACTAAGFTPDLTRQSFADFQYDRLFGAILIPVGSFTLIDSFEAGMAALVRLRDHLIPGGRLVFDIGGLQQLAPGPVDRRQWTAENGDLLTLEGHPLRTDWMGQRIEAQYRYERWRDSRLIETQLEPWVQRLWGRHEMELALESVGFHEITIIGRFRPGRPVSGRDRVLTFSALRR